MEGHRRKNSWLTIGVSGCCASRDDVASEKGHNGMFNKFLSSYKQRELHRRVDCNVRRPCDSTLQLQFGGDTPVCLAVNDPQCVELHHHLA